MHVLVSLVQQSTNYRLLTGAHSGRKAFTDPELRRHIKISHGRI